MGIKIARGTDELHPEGMFKFCVCEMEETKGKFGRQIKWGMESTERREDGEKFRLTYYTGTVISTHPDCKLTKLLAAMELDEEAFEGDTDEALGCTFAGKVEEDDEGKYANIVKVFTIDDWKAKAKGKAKDAAEGRRNKKDHADPFAEE